MSLITEYLIRVFEVHWINADHVHEGTESFDPEVKCRSRYLTSNTPRPVCLIPGQVWSHLDIKLPISATR